MVNEKGYCGDRDNEACIICNHSGYVYWETSAISVDEFVDHISKIADKYGINFDNLHIDTIEIRDSEGYVVDKREF